jgi:hypothetical protein
LPIALPLLLMYSTSCLPFLCTNCEHLAMLIYLVIVIIFRCIGIWDWEYFLIFKISFCICDLYGDGSFSCSIKGLRWKVQTRFPSYVVLVATWILKAFGWFGEDMVYKCTIWNNEMIQGFLRACNWSELNSFTFWSVFSFCQILCCLLSFQFSLRFVKCNVYCF